MKNTNQQGFTLVELAIVLVIIGLIIGGVLVGQDMIRSAEIRSTIGQYEKYNTAINTFRDKYRGIPGDLGNATNFGFTASPTRRDNDGSIEDCGTGMLLGCETALFWEDLSKAQLLGENLAAGGLATANHAAAGAVTGVLPTAKIGNGNVWQIYNSTGRNWYHLSTVDTTGAGPTTTAGVSPNVAFNMDSKVDDGAPSTGLVLADSARGTTDAVVTGVAGVCRNATGYNTDNGVANGAAGEQDTPACQLQMRAN